jgi:YD repeat-containing protein
MKYNYGLIVVIVACLYASYAGVQKYNARMAIAEDEAVIDSFISGQPRENFAGKESPSEGQENPSASGKSSQEVAKILADGSKLSVMYDGFGNKTETRCFNNSPRLKCVTLTSAAASGLREAVAYGPNGERNIVPENMLDKVLTGTGDEIANSAGIFATQRQMPQEVYSRTTSQLPSSKSADNQSPIQNKPAPQIDDIKQPESINNSEIESSGDGSMKNLLNEKRTVTARKLQ